MVSNYSSILFLFIDCLKALREMHLNLLLNEIFTPRSFLSTFIVAI